MKIYNKSYSLTQFESFLSCSFPYRTIFVDIETTGLSSKKNNIYCIGLAFFQNDQILIRQLFAQKQQEEKEILSEFLDFLSQNCNSIYTFNGKTFDLPFLEKRCALHGFSFSATDYPGKDLLQDFRPLKNLLQLPHLRQKDLEQFLGIGREDLYDGGKLISVYMKYEETQDPELEHLLRLHNHEDMLGMLRLLPIYQYNILFQGEFKIQSMHVITEKDHLGTERNSLEIHLSLSDGLPKNITGVNEQIRFLFHGKEGIVSLPVCEDTLHYYLPDYKNYYYLTEEHTIIHKSIAQFVDSQFCQKATPDNCYLPKKGMFLAGNKKSDFFRFQQDRKDKTYYMDLSDLLDVDQKILSADITPALQEELQLLIAERLKKFKPML